MQCNEEMYKELFSVPHSTFTLKLRGNMYVVFIMSIYNTIISPGKSGIVLMKCPCVLVLCLYLVSLMCAVLCLYHIRRTCRNLV